MKEKIDYHQPASMIYNGDARTEPDTYSGKCLEDMPLWKRMGVFERSRCCSRAGESTDCVDVYSTYPTKAMDVTVGSAGEVFFTVLVSMVSNFT